MRKFLLPLILSAISAAPASADDRFMCSDYDGLMQSRIVGGNDIGHREVPYQIAIRIGGSLCGGSLISRRYVLTAAHCVVDKQGDMHRTEQVSARYGGVTIQDGQQAQVESIHVHPSYSVTSHKHDIAILRLDRRLDVPGDWIIALQTDRMDRVFGGPGSCARVSGYGRLKQGGNVADSLQAVNLPVRNTESCAKAYGGRYDPEIMVCAGVADLDSCQGDSGGPLVVAGGPTKRSLLGVVSFGQGCGRPGFPGVYTRVSAYIDWIVDITRRGI